MILSPSISRVLRFLAAAFYPATFLSGMLREISMKEIVPNWFNRSEHVSFIDSTVKKIYLNRHQRELVLVSVEDIPRVLSSTCSE